jgi:hypothetical protein
MSSLYREDRASDPWGSHDTCGSFQTARDRLNAAIEAIGPVPARALPEVQDAIGTCCATLFPLLRRAYALAGHPYGTDDCGLRRWVCERAGLERLDA